ncbi:protein BLISTER-like [Papaver somniferum]|uniref:protein BLISTER-like n=1 Tax=Papaver somniferum TaxID=3469 RepID=UPI000E6F4FF6|nr:protein BLISTER-like [Papaver somniferum]
MASAQVSRKQDLEAGKRKLEEFRKKKAERRIGKKVAPIGQTQPAADVSQSEDKKALQIPDSDGAGPSERNGVSYEEPPPSAVVRDDTKAYDSSQTTELGSSSVTHDSPPISNKTHDVLLYAGPFQKPAADQDSRWYDRSRLPESQSVNYAGLREDMNHNIDSAGTREPTYEATVDQPATPKPFYRTGGTDTNSQSDYYSRYDGHLRQDSKEFSAKAPETSHVFNADFQFDKLADDVGFGTLSTSGSQYEDRIHPSANLTESVLDFKNKHGGSDFNGASFLEERRKFNNSINHQQGTDNAPWLSSELPSIDYKLDSRSSSNHVPHTASIAGNRQSRPSFLGSLNVNTVPSESHISCTDQEKSEPFLIASKAKNQTQFSSASRWPFSSTVGNFDSLKSDLFGSSEPLLNLSVSIGNDAETLRQSTKENNAERKQESFLPKHDENFAALEQHIEDLTQEKFSLQRSLDASRSLSESLAAENSSLTDSYNQQGALVNQLRLDMERLQEEIRAQLLEIESIKMEYVNAQLECTAADERAQILTSEVIELEEKALRLRSSELKLERQLENSNDEITSYKRKVSILEKERQDLQLTINAMQEEKKVLQSKLRNASGGEKSFDVQTPSVKDMLTSTQDLEVSGGEIMSSTFDPEMQEAAFPLPGSSSAIQLPENSQFHPSVSSAAIPPDQLYMIGNINSLISELVLEKEELTRALVSESSNSSTLKELNRELSRKLEAQTQRLELLTAQSMASENLQARQPDLLTMNDSTTYADEGDEVVERVLGWIMKLLPGGPTKRRTSKLL